VQFNVFIGPSYVRYTSMPVWVLYTVSQRLVAA